MAFSDYSTMMSVVGGLTAVGVLIKTYQSIAEKWKRAKEKQANEYRAAVLHEAKEHISRLKLDLKKEIDELKMKLDTVEANIDKDLIHLKETYNGEIKNLGQKIEDLRTELRNQHGQLVQLLSKMIDARD